MVRFIYRKSICHNMFVERDLRTWFEKVDGVYDMISLVGPRQAGKTTFLKHLIQGTKAEYLSFDDPVAREMFEQDINMFQRQYLSNESTTVLDEVGYCNNAGIGLKYLVDNGNKLWITSSSETLLGKEVMSYLVGRVSILRLFQFNTKSLKSVFFPRPSPQRYYALVIIITIILKTKM